MHPRILGALTASAALFALLGPGTAAASDHAGTIYLETNSATRNAVVAYQRHADGSLSRGAAYTPAGPARVPNWLRRAR